MPTEPVSKALHKLPKDFLSRPKHEQRAIVRGIAEAVMANVKRD